MEPIGAIASISGLIHLATKCFVYVDQVRSGSKDAESLRSVILAIQEVLALMKTHSQDYGPKLFQGLSKSIGECQKELEDLECKLNRSKSRGKRFWSALGWPLKAVEYRDILERISKHRECFAGALQVANNEMTKEIQSSVKGLGAEFKDFHHSYQSRSRAQSIREVEAEENANERRRKAVLEWLYPNRIDTKHNAIHATRVSGTGEWLLGDRNFEAWTAGPADILWGYGIRISPDNITATSANILFKAGAGKTFLSSRVIDHFLERAEHESLGVAYIYFDYKQHTEQTPMAILSSLLKQLSLQHDKLPEALEKLHTKLEKHDGRPGAADLQDIICSLFESFEKTVFLFDAMDECSPECMTRALAWLHMFRSNGAYIFVTSREYPEEIKKSFRNARKIQLKAVGNDITTFVNEKINQTQRLQSFIKKDPTLQDQILWQLIEEANGMFLLVNFHVEYLRTQTTISQLRQALNGLRVSAAANATRDYPLDETYTRVWQVISQQPRHCTELAHRILTWLFHGDRTFTVEEIQIAVSLRPGQKVLDEEDCPDPDTMLEVCAGLITIDESSQVIRLSHLTVHDYLCRATEIGSENRNPVLAETCINYLGLKKISGVECESNQIIDQLLLDNSFLEYAASHMATHLKFCPINTANKFIRQIHQDIPVVRIWLRSRIYLSWNRLVSSESLRDLFRFPPPLTHLIAFIGHQDLLLLMLKENGIWGLDQYQRGVLHWAAMSGDAGVTATLIDQGADPVLKDSRGMASIHNASFNGHVKVVKCLLDAGTPVNIRGIYDYTPLHAAVYREEPEVVHLLLEQKGINVNLRIESGETAVYWAASRGNSRLLKALLDRGACPAIPAKYNLTPLYAASRAGYFDVVSILLEHPNVKVDTASFGGTPLLMAVQKGHLSIARLLLDHGADPLLKKTNWRYSPLDYARLHNLTAFVELLSQYSSAGGTIVSVGSEGQDP